MTVPPRLRMVDELKGRATDVRNIDTRWREARAEEHLIDPPPHRPHGKGMDEVTQYRLDQYEKKADAADARMGRVEHKLSAIEVTLATMPTRDNLRNWGLSLIAITIATGIGAAAVMLQSSGNQLSAFQAGLSAIEAVASSAQAAPAKH